VAEAQFVDRGGGHWSFAGELGVSSVPGLLARATPALRGSGDISVDLSGVVRADSAGLALLVELLRGAARNGRSIVFRDVPEQLLSIARVCGLDGILSLSRQPDAAGDNH